MVYLIGAGPGNPGFISTIGADIIKQADCIIYDRLINPSLLDYRKISCECIYVGKENSNHTLSQEEINKLLIEKAKEYKIVVRLKGGDCYVFGRGGEEGLTLYDAKVPFEVIPGIPSFIGGLAWSGIPITHRGIATGIHILTAHKKNNEPLDIDFSSIKDNETTIFMMGLSKLEEIVSNLLQYKDKDFPIAIVYNGSNENQKICISTLENIVEDFNKDPFPSPCLIIVGNVIRYQKQLNFISRKCSIAFPRVSNDISYLSNSLTVAGYQVNEYHVSNLERNDFALQKISLSDYTHVVFSSKFGVQCFFELLQAQHIDLRSLSNLKFCVIGAATGKELEKHGIYADFCPSYYTSEDLCQLLNESIELDSKLLICTVKGNEEKWNALKHSKEFVYLYCNVEKRNPISNLSEKGIVFTCSSAVRQTLKQVQIPKNTLIFSIGPKTTQTLHEHGYFDIIESKQADYPSLLDCIQNSLMVQEFEK